MSTVAIAWVPEGLSVSADTRSTIIDGTILNDYSLKILPFYEHNFFIALCGKSNFGSQKFEEFMQESVDNYFEHNPDLHQFILELLNRIINNKECSNCHYEIIIAGYNKIDNKEIVALINTEKELTNSNTWYITELNGYSETDSQMILIDELYENSHLYGVYVAGIDIRNIREVYKYCNSKDRIQMDKDFRNKTLLDAKWITNEIVEETIDKFDNDEDISVVGGMITSYILPRNRF